MNKPITFQTTIKQMGNNTGIQVPEEVVEALGAGKQPLVRVIINGDYSYRSAVAVMSGNYMISFSSAHRKASGLLGGDAVEVTLEVDLDPRTVEIPTDLKEALVAANVLTEFENAAPSAKKEFVRQVTEAKQQATRERRIVKIVEKLSGK